MKTSIRWVLKILMVLTFTSGFIYGAAPNHSDHFSNVPSSMLAKANPYSGHPQAVLAGKKLFDHHCSACHGRGAEGSGRAPSLKGDVIQYTAPGAILWFLKKGDLKHSMPAWSQLPEPTLWQIVTYLKTLP
ncbi:MAG: cytochrome c [Acidobacteriia bacterium]|nr:cytochrome c [Terriglobia bacterium]